MNQDKPPAEKQLAEMQRPAFGTEAWLGDVFSYHAPSPEQIVQYQRIREGAKEFAKVILENTPRSADQTAAIRKVREAVMTANASIALRGIA
jgi:hypothetical protein